MASPSDSGPDRLLRALLSGVTYDELGHGSPEGWWGMKCWNRMPPAQQEQLVITGHFYGYEDWDSPERCDEPARVAVETENDLAPGPRFYCRLCAIKRIIATS